MCLLNRSKPVAWNPCKAMEHHLHLYDLDETRKNRVPAHSDQGNIRKHLRDHHRSECRHLRSVVWDSPISSRLLSPGVCTFPAVLPGEAWTAGHISEHPALNHMWSTIRWQESELGTENGPDSRPSQRSSRQSAAKCHCFITSNAKEARSVCLVICPGACVEFNGLKPSHGRRVSQMKLLGHRWPVLLNKKCRVSA